METSLRGNNDLDRLFSALADPTRRAILDRLREGEATVNELAAPFDVHLPAISKHLTVLENAGLIQRRAEAQRRHCSLDEAGFRDLERWTRHYTELWTGSLDRLADVFEDDK